MRSRRGRHRLGTSLAAYDAARKAGSASDTVVVATGSNYADALAIGPWAWSSASPVLLADATGRLTPEAVERIKSDAAVRRVLLLGGTAVVSDGVREQLGDAYTYARLAGADRYATATEVARWSCENGLTWSTVAVATGTGFADALAAAPTLGKVRAPLLLASDAAVSLVREKASSIGSLCLLGGTAAVSSAQESALAAALTGTSGATDSYASGSSSSGSSHYVGSTYYSGPAYVPGGSYNPQPTPQPEPQDSDDPYAGEEGPETRGELYLWPDEEDVLVKGKGAEPALLASSAEGEGDDVLYARAEEHDQAVARTSQIGRAHV